MIRAFAPLNHRRADDALSTADECDDLHFVIRIEWLVILSRSHESPIEFDRHLFWLQIMTLDECSKRQTVFQVL